MADPLPMRPGARLVAVLPPDASFTWTPRGLVVVERDAPPYLLRWAYDAEGRPLLDHVPIEVRP